MAEEKFFLGRQPILDSEQKLFGFELLFRSADTLHACITDYLQASASVIFTSLSNFGFREVVGRHKGFINVTEDVLMSEALELLPREQVVVELLESVPVSDAVVERCRELKAKGFTLALDDNIYSPVYIPLYKIVDIVKVDLLQIAPSAMPGMVKKLKRWKPLLLAEKVETVEQYQMCLKLGFTYFQGYYFSRPVVLTRARVDIGRMALVRLFNQLVAEVDLREIEETFKLNPNLIYNLLRLVNSVATGLRDKITTLRHAIMVLGYQQLRRWAMMALFAFNASGGTDNALLVMAASRGRLMELLVRRQQLSSQDKDYPDRAFMTGILSLAEALLEVPIDEMVEQLNLDDDVRLALLAREGELGNLLSLVEMVEKNDFKGIVPLLDQLGLNLETLAPIQLEVFNWMAKIEELG